MSLQYTGTTLSMWTEPMLKLSSVEGTDVDWGPVSYEYIDIMNYFGVYGHLIQYQCLQQPSDEYNKLV